MGNAYHRNIFFNINKYQKPIIALTSIPAIIFCLITSVLIIFLQRALDTGTLVAHDPFVLLNIQQWSIYMLVTLWSFYAFFMLLAHIISNHSLGAFERIIREMDELIAHRKIQSIKARVNDQLANDLLKRINILIDNIQWPQEKGTL